MIQIVFRGTLGALDLTDETVAYSDCVCQISLRNVLGNTLLADCCADILVELGLWFHGKIFGTVKLRIMPSRNFSYNWNNAIYDLNGQKSFGCPAPPLGQPTDRGCDPRLVFGVYGFVMLCGGRIEKSSALLSVGRRRSKVRKPFTFSLAALRPGS